MLLLLLLARLQVRLQDLVVLGRRPNLLLVRVSQLLIEVGKVVFRTLVVLLRRLRIEVFLLVCVLGVVSVVLQLLVAVCKFEVDGELLLRRPN